MAVLPQDVRVDGWALPSFPSESGQVARVSVKIAAGASIMVVSVLKEDELGILASSCSTSRAVVFVRRQWGPF
jgi:hypothetical protein